MQPQIIAHRGASHEVAEHTLAAYATALRQGADALECDVRLTADGHLVCVHDRDLRRTAGSRAVVSKMELADLAALDFAARTTMQSPGSGEDRLEPEAPELDPEHRGVLTLRRLFETVAAHDRRIEIAVETKHPSRHAGKVERTLVELLEEFGWHRAGSPVRVMSFSRVALARVERLAPELRLVMLFEHAWQWSVLRHVIGDDWIAGPGIDALRESPAFARRLSSSGREVHVWTVNSTTELQTCLDLGVEAVITDRPRDMVVLLTHMGSDS